MQRSDLRHQLQNAYLTIHRDSETKLAKEDEHWSIQNLSRGGIRFCSTEHFDIDERVELELYIDDQLSHQAHGRICYHDEDNQHNNYYGVSFLDKYLHL